MDRADKAEPPARPQSQAPFLIGRDSRGNWVVRDQHGLCGGIFVNQREALRFALHANDDRPPAIIVTSGHLEFHVAPRVKSETLQRVPLQTSDRAEPMLPAATAPIRRAAIR